MLLNIIFGGEFNYPPWHSQADQVSLADEAKIKSPMRGFSRFMYDLSENDLFVIKERNVHTAVINKGQFSHFVGFLWFILNQVVVIPHLHIDRL